MFCLWVSYMSNNITVSAQSEKAKPSFFNNPRNRSVLYQLLLLAGLAYFLLTIVGNTLANLEALGIKSGFDFLGDTAGFDILMTLISFEPSDTYGRTFIVGLLNTLLVSALGIIVATVLGFFIGIARLSQNWLLNRLAMAYVELFRNIPLLLQIYFWYFAVLAALPDARESLSIGEAIFLNVRGLYFPALVGGSGSWLVHASIVVAIIAIFVLRHWAKKRQNLTGEQFPMFWASLGIFFGLPFLALLVTGFPFTLDYPEFSSFNFSGGINLIPELMALTLALSIYTASFIGEAVRAGVQSVAHGQTEAARSLGLREGRILMLIIVPQAMRVIIPQLNSQYQNLIKNSTLATAIGYPELFSVFAGTTLNQTGQAIEIMSMTMAVYLLVNLLVSFVMNVVNAKVALVERK